MNYAKALDGCCGASAKGTCTRPPCPCNLSDYSPRELRDLEAERRERVRKAPPLVVLPSDYEAGL